MINLTDSFILDSIYFTLFFFFLNVNSIQENKFHNVLARAMCTFPTTVLNVLWWKPCPQFLNRFYIFVFTSPPLYFMSFHPKFEVNIFYKLFKSLSVILHISLFSANINKPLFILWPLLTILRQCFFYCFGQTVQHMTKWSFFLELPCNDSLSKR